ncbi:hypothetical protein BDA96_10G056400 [Sorghum bicolor]|uniref:DUF569 domain-containing protein n=2 Tax=Sorghum bicolor TaxID=4558 RepID=A0A921TZP9_SORBI|nr:hypothetical protein BDA96_10G056400 [Sorghum bicolor]KXG19358.1 hypothetical protein SORBI_3010G048200 [Sorghum bicolor]
MESFPDRTHVWLWIREYEAYLSAREDGEGIDISENPGALHGAWAVHRLVRDGTDYVLFHSAAYGRYLARIEDEDDESYYLVQCTYDSPEQDNVLFQTRGAEDGSDDIIISNRSFGDLCHDHEGTPMHWVVEAIPPRQLPPELPVPPDPIPPPQLRRAIHYVRADDQGNFNPLQWRFLEFEGQSVFNLRRDIAAELGEANNVLGITLCAYAGSSGRLTPLVIDLPSDAKTMNIVVLTTGSTAAQELVYANVDPP